MKADQGFKRFKMACRATGYALLEQNDVEKAETASEMD